MGGSKVFSGAAVRGGAVVGGCSGGKKLAVRVVGWGGEVRMKE